MRILVTGSRTWTDAHRIEQELRDVISYHYGYSYDYFKNHKPLPTDVLLGPYIVVHGDASRGADRITRDWLRRAYTGATEEAHPADWARYHGEAGLKRNDEMVALGADLVLAFWDGRSPGTRHCINAALAAGLRVRIIYSDDALGVRAGTTVEFNVAR